MDPGIVWFVLKGLFVFFCMAMVRSLVPRYRYDQLMRLGWKVFLPISLFMVFATAFVLQITGWAQDRPDPSQLVPVPPVAISPVKT